MRHMNYITRVENATEKFRSMFLGQETPFSALLPRGGAGMNIEQQADELADLLLFAIIRLGETFPLLNEGIRTCLRTTILYLLEQCRPSDHTFADLRKLLALDKGIRELLFEHPRYRALQDEALAPLPRWLDEALLDLFEARKIAADKEFILKEFEGLLEKFKK